MDPNIPKQKLSTDNDPSGQSDDSYIPGRKMARNYFHYSPEDNEQLMSEAPGQEPEEPWDFASDEASESIGSTLPTANEMPIASARNLRPPPAANEVPEASGGIRRSTSVGNEVPKSSGSTRRSPSIANEVPQASRRIHRPPPGANESPKESYEEIMDIERQTMEHYRALAERRQRQRVNKDDKEIKVLFEAKKKKEMESRATDIEAEYQKKIESLAKSYERKLQASLKECLDRCNGSVEEVIALERSTAIQRILKKLQKEVSYMIIDLYDGLQSNFSKIICAQVEKYEQRMKAFEERTDNGSIVFKLIEKNKHLSELVNSICTERYNWNYEMNSLSKRYKKQIETLTELLSYAKYIITQLQKDVQQPASTNTEHNTRMQNVVGEFKNFVNSGVSSLPQPTEFSISIPDMLSSDSDNDDDDSDNLMNACNADPAAIIAQLPRRQEQ